MRPRSATNSVPLWNTSPFGASRPLSSTFASRLPPLSTTAYTSCSCRVPTKSVPLSPCAMVRAPGMPSAHTSTLKPAGTLSLSTGRSFADLPVISIANGCSVDSCIAAGLPCCQEGGGDAAGLSCACAAVNAPRTAAASAALMDSLLWFAPLLELKACLDSSAHVAPRCGLEVTKVGLIDNHRADVVAIADVVEAHELAEPQPPALLHQARRGVPDSERVSEVGVGIVDRDARAVQHLNSGLERGAAVAQLAIRLVLRHAGKRGARGHRDLRRRRRNRRREALPERGVQEGIRPAQLPRPPDERFTAQLKPFAVGMANVLEGGA